MDFSNLLEYLVPILFLIIFVISKALGKKGEGEDKKSEWESDDQPPAFDMEDVQEEIRRKLQERREVPAPTRQTQQEGQSTQYQPHYRSPKVAPMSTHHRPKKAASAPKKRDYQAEILKQLQKAKAAKLHVENIRKQNRIKTQESYALRRHVQANLGIAREIVKDTYSARRGFIAYEIFGTPLALRDNGRMKQGWDI